MNELLDRDKLREQLVLHLDKNYRVSIFDMSKRIGISHAALLDFIHAAKMTHRRTLGVVRAYLQSLEKSEEIK